MRSMTVPDRAQSPSSSGLKRRNGTFLSALFKGVFGTDGDLTGSLVRVLAAGVRLEAQERLLLKMCYRDNLGVAEAGRMLGMNRHQVHGRLRRLLARLRDDFERAGIGREVRVLLENGCREGQESETFWQELEQEGREVRARSVDLSPDEQKILENLLLIIGTDTADVPERCRRINDLLAEGRKGQ